MSNLLWNAAKHPNHALARDSAGEAWVPIVWHPEGPGRGRERAQEDALAVCSRFGVVYVPLSWLQAEYTRSIENASRKMDLKKVVALTHQRDVGLKALEKQAPRSRESSIS